MLEEEYVFFYGLVKWIYEFYYYSDVWMYYSSEVRFYL